MNKGHLVVVLVGMMGVACSSGDPVQNEVIGTAEEALVCGYPTCPETTTIDVCSGGRWPGGIIYYKFASEVPANVQTAIRQVMNDWTSISNYLISFTATTAQSTSSFPVITIHYPGGDSVGHDGCAANPTEQNCSAHMELQTAYHEVGHLTGFTAHHWQRYDGRHYWKAQSTPRQMCSQVLPRCSIPAESNPLDYGPFNFQSAMLYNPTHPDHTRWDGSSIAPNAQCDLVDPGPGTPPPGCPGGLHCPTCTECTYKNQPGGFPTYSDGAAVVEFYRSYFDPAWKKFTRTVAEDVGAGVNQPYDYSISSGVTIPSNGNPAVETWEGGTLSIYLRGSNNAIWEKTRDVANNKWLGWSSLGTPSGSGSLSDPAIASWGAGRTDLVVRRGITVYIKTHSNGAFGTWQSLGTPGSNPVSSPAITSWGTNRLDVFVRGANDRLYWKKCTANCLGNTGTWAAWSVVGTGTFRGMPAAVSRGTGLVDVFVHGMDDQLWGIENLNDVWTEWYKVSTTGTLKWDPSCPDCSSPAAGARGPNLLDVYARGLDDGLWVATWSGGATWSPFISLGGVLKSSPATFTRLRSTNRADIIAIMAEERTTGDLRYGAWWKKYEP